MDGDGGRPTAQPSRVQVQVVLYRSQRWLATLAAGLRQLTPSRGGLRITYWDNDPGWSASDLLQALPAGSGVFSSREGNVGFGEAHNRLAERAPWDCEYLFLLNPDAVPQFDCLERLVAVGDANPTAALIEAAQFPIEHPKAYDRSTGETNWCSGAGLLVRRRAFTELGGFDPEIFLYCEDVDLSWRAWAAGWRCLYVPEARCVHVTESQALGKDRTAEIFHSHLSQLYLRRKHFGPDAVQAYLGAMTQQLSPRFVERVWERLAQLPGETGSPVDNPHIVLTAGETYGPRRW